MRKIIPFLCYLLLIGAEAYPQSATVSSGESVTQGTSSVSYSVGQVFYIAGENTGNGTINNGVQQPYKISIVTGIDDIAGIKLSIAAYPNPVTDLLVLNIEPESLITQGVDYQLSDISGKTLVQGKVFTYKSEIDMSTFPKSTYILQVFNKNKIIKTFKILKK